MFWPALFGISKSNRRQSRSLPKSNGFVFLFNGEEVLQFDVVLTPHAWQSPSGDVKLLDLPTWKSPPDAAGLLFVTTFKARFPAGQASRLGVRSLEKGSDRWFAVNPVGDVTRLEISKPVR